MDAKVSHEGHGHESIWAALRCTPERKALEAHQAELGREIQKQIGTGAYKATLPIDPFEGFRN